MRVLIATLSRDLLGGAEKYLESLLPALVRRGHTLALLYESSSAASARGIDTGAGPLPAWSLKELGRESALRSVAEWNPDVVYSHGLDDGETEDALQRNYRTILYAHTYYATCVSGTKCHAFPRLEPCSRRFGTACLFVYYPRRCGGLNPRTMWQLFEMQSQRNARLAGYQAILVASRHMYREYQRHGVQPGRLQLLPLYPTDSVPEAGAPLSRPCSGRILFVGRLVEVKGVTHLVEAVRLASAKLGYSLRLTIAGDGAERPGIEGLARRLEIPVEFAGWVDSNRRAELMRQADLLAMPSLWPEPFGLAGVEAGCFGLPAVGFAVGGIPDWLIAGQTGEIAPADPPTSAGLAEAIVRALSDPAHYQTLRHGAWEMAQRFSMERHIEQLEQILGAGVIQPQLLPSVV